MEKTLHKSLLYEEKQATKWFLGLFYGTLFIYDIIYFYLFPYLPWATVEGATPNLFEFSLYIVMVGLIPVSIYLINVNRAWVIKYICFCSYTFLNIVGEIVLYSNTEAQYSSGNLAELVIILFAPIFVNKKYFFTVVLGTTFKYLIVGLFLQSSEIMFPLVIVIILSIVTYIILRRIISYVEAVMNSYDKQIEGIVKGIIATLELKDPYTRGHSERVAEYAMALATETGKFNKDELKYFYYACLLHDIGKIHIPDAILTKPGKLTNEEYNVVKEHPLVGAKAVQEVEGISANIDVVLHHHERWDGKGYPSNLRGKETPILARITAIADAFDAMTSSRSYRSALSLDDAYTRIVEGKGTQFDPDLVEIFKSVYPKWKQIHQKHNENNSIN